MHEWILAEDPCTDMLQYKIGKTTNEQKQDQDQPEEGYAWSRRALQRMRTGQEHNQENPDATEKQSEPPPEELPYQYSEQGGLRLARQENQAMVARSSKNDSRGTDLTEDGFTNTEKGRESRAEYENWKRTRQPMAAGSSKNDRRTVGGGLVEDGFTHTQIGQEARKEVRCCIS